MSVVLLAATLVGIWVLTEQSAEETSALSGSVAEAIEAGAGSAGVAASDDAAGASAGGAGAAVPAGADDATAASTGASGDAAAEGSAAAAQPSGEPSALSRLMNEVATWASLNVRRLAHTAEFAAVGLLASLAIVCLGGERVRGRRRAIAGVAFCALCSLVDQTHKLFVPGRHFDPVDLAFDAVGYLVACALVFAAARVVRAVRRPTGVRQGLEEG